MRVSTGQMSQKLMQGLSEQQASLAKIQEQLSSGKKIINASDNPIASASILALNQSVSMMSRYSDNINSLESRLSLEETVLSQQFEVLTEIKSLVIRANSGSMTADDKKSIANTISGYITTMTELANTKDSSGEYLFSGYAASTKPFDNSSGVYEYKGDGGIRYLQTGFSSKIQASDSGKIFEIKIDDIGTTNNIFKLMEDFSSKLSVNSENQDDFSTMLDFINAGDEAIIATRSSLGNRLTSIDVQRSMNNSMKINLETSRANLSELDYAKAITELTSKITSLQAAQKSFSKISQISLFSYMN